VLELEFCNGLDPEKNIVNAFKNAAAGSTVLVVENKVQKSGRLVRHFFNPHSALDGKLLRSQSCTV
jgi:hypothetical protein